ncbi:MAG: sigma-54 dependent transcriptional regulator [Candidatus Binatia bacterium]
MSTALPSFPSRELSETDGLASTPRFLIVEKKPEIQALLKSWFSADIHIDAMPVLDIIAHKSKETAYDILIWNADSSPSQRCKGLEMLERISRDSPETQIIVISHEEGNPASSRIRTGNYQYVGRPIDWNNLFVLVSQTLKKCSPGQRILSYPDVRVPVEFEGMLSISLPMREVFQRIVEAASADIPVLITGETGTGKDLIAAAIHKRSPRKDGPYVAVNIGAMTRELMASELFGHERGAYTGASGSHQGFFEQAHRGTIFLDEISTMDEKAQVSLLRVLETQTFRRVGGEKDIRVDARVLTATNDSLEEAVKKGRFREDLYYRLDVFPIHVPPLRSRPGAVTFLTNQFVMVFDALYNKNVREIAPETYRYLRRYPWPGNVRELKNVVQRAVLMAQGEEMTPDLIPARIREAAESRVEAEMQKLPIHIGMPLDAVEKEFIRMTLGSTRGNKKEAASILRISRRALYNKLKKYGLM